jgi:hypothetical protein
MVVGWTFWSRTGVWRELFKVYWHPGINALNLQGSQVNVCVDVNAQELIPELILERTASLHNLIEPIVVDLYMLPVPADLDVVLYVKLNQLADFHA